MRGVETHRLVLNLNTNEQKNRKNMMENWLIIAWASVTALTVLWLWLLNKTKGKKKSRLPPGPATVPIVGNMMWLRKSFYELEPVLRRLHALNGPMVTLHIGPRPAVFVADRSIARQALLLSGPAFASRPPPTSISFGAIAINSSPYGATWRALRRNLASEMLHHSRLPSFSPARSSALESLLTRLEEKDDSVRVVDHFRRAVLRLLAAMCFGGDEGDSDLVALEDVQRRLLLGFGRFAMLNFLPRLTRVLMRGRWEELARLHRDQDASIGSLVRVRAEKRGQGGGGCYADTLLELRVPDGEGGGTRKLKEREMVTLCSEFLNAGTDTTSTSLQWIMANLVKYPEIQDRVYAEIKEEVGARPEEARLVSEEEVGRLRYLKAVVMEALRRHPPGHFLLPHAVTEEMELGGYRIPKHGTINFTIAEMAWDPAVWDDPMAFKPERFLNDDDHQYYHGFPNEGKTGSSNGEIKMMPFGAGRRICPGSDLALLHLHYFVANLVWRFKWDPDPDHPIDLAEKQEFTIVMKHPLRASLSPRI